MNEDFDKASHLAQQIKNSIRTELKLSCSIGVSSNKLISKIASDYQKPDGLTIVQPEKIENFLEELNIRVIPGIGKKTEQKFKEMNLETIQEIKKIDVFTLNKEFGRKNGTYIYNAIRGINDEPVKEKEESIQYSKIITLKKDSKEYEFLLENLYELCKQIHDLIKNNNKMFKSIGIHFVQSDLSNKSKSKMLRNSTNNLEELEKNVEQLLTDALEDQSYFGAEQIIIVSASSKTAIGLAQGLQETSNAPSITGLTSEKNLDFVKNLGCYDEVITYDGLSDVNFNLKSVMVDMAGSREILGTLHGSLGNKMLKCLTVGMTHWDNEVTAEDALGQAMLRERTEFFFAPAHIQKRVKDWGYEGYNQKTNEFMEARSNQSIDWMAVKKIEGLENFISTYEKFVSGDINPNEGIIVGLEND